MTLTDQVITWERGKLGVSEYPPQSNCQEFSHAMHRPCEAWCADFQSTAEIANGVDLTQLGLGHYGSASCAVWVAAYKRASRFSLTTPRVGAHVFFGPGGGSHIEKVTDLRMGPGGVVGIMSLGGNTSAPNNYAGGTVAEHYRPFGPGADIYGYGYPLYLDQPTSPPSEEDDEMDQLIIIGADGGAGLYWSNPAFTTKTGIPSQDAITEARKTNPKIPYVKLGLAELRAVPNLLTGKPDQA